MGEPLVLASRVHDVRLFRRGALVTRVASLPEGPWPAELALDGLPLSLLDDSVRLSLLADGAGGLPAPGDVRVELALPAMGEGLAPPTEAEVREAADAVDALRRRIAAVDRELGWTGTVSLRLAGQHELRPPRPAPVQAWRGLLSWQHGLRSARVEERLELVAALREAEERLARIQRRDAEVRARKDARADAVRKRVRLSLRGGGAPRAATLQLEYRVTAARWAPSYVVRMARDGASAELAVRALVEQRTGEAWAGVRLSCSTADLFGATALPELASLRIGRAMPEPPPRGWRAPPEGLDGLFSDVERALAKRPASPREPSPPARATSGARSESVVFESRMASVPDAMPPMPPPSPMASMAPPPPPLPSPAPTRGGAPMPGAAPTAPRPSAPAARARRVAEAPSAKKAAPAPSAVADEDEYPSAEPPEEAEGGAASAPGRPSRFAASPVALRFGELVLRGFEAGAGERGRLRPTRLEDRLVGLPPESAGEVAARLSAAAAAEHELAVRARPPGACDVAAETGAFDHRYDAEGPVDVPSDGAAHTVPLLARRAAVRTTLVVVPRESTTAVRVAALENPLGAPLLAGPADVYLEDEFLVAAPLRTVPAGGVLSVGLGLEEGLKVARNTHHEEEKAGMLGGRIELVTRVELELASRLPAEVQVEVRERIPVLEAGEEQVQLGAAEATPPWEVWDQAEQLPIRGGRRWRFPLAAGATQRLSYQYRVRIDARDELVGGNRREP